jgi:hypothetical protein
MNSSLLSNLFLESNLNYLAIQEFNITMIRKHKKDLIIFSALVVFIFSLAALLYFVRPEQIVSKIGVNNAYLFALLVSFFAGFSALTSFSMVAVLLTLAAGGVNPIYLGLISGVGLAIGDIIMFFASSEGRELVSENVARKLDKVHKFFARMPRTLVPVMTYIYIGLTPLPNDFLIIFLALIKYPVKRLYIPIILGDMTFTLMITLLAVKGILFFG